MEPEQSIAISEVKQDDRAWPAQEITREFASTRVFSAHQMFDTNELPALVAKRDGRRCGLASYRIDGAECELVAFLTTERRAGVGTALVDALRDLAIARGCRRLFLTTSNDNLEAMAFYQKRGFRFARIHRGSMDEARELISGLPATGDHGIPVHDDIEFDMPLTPATKR
jgi:ribosomal protein S18 acetylase RimI-like enzyme